ncbi:hypothetical protein IQ264_31820 [Phormidium sp. LEGE 05292]|uniref:hypothetical protein n=1 Tax=[Phormidium] sp. LEGE 05292 TaxID=767427 RepID=UPI0018808DFA|nr:hypothetical protein [Phormidium sp. LEGE 05292]MBE9229990.1 hypothetical protein [Phormidium sp. LEGE 05292]
MRDKLVSSPIAFFGIRISSSSQQFFNSLQVFSFDRRYQLLIHIDNIETVCDRTILSLNPYLG